MICYNARWNKGKTLYIIHATTRFGERVEFVGKTEQDAHALFDRARDHEQKTFSQLNNGVSICLA